MELLAAYGVQLDAPRLSGGLPAPTFLTFAGVVAPSYSGFIVLGTTEAILQQSNRTNSNLSDWIAELGNQLLGRVKNRLMRQNIIVHRVPPAVVMGAAASALQMYPGLDAVALTDGKDIVWIWSSAEGSCSQPPDRLIDCDNDVLAEGDMILF